MSDVGRERRSQWTGTSPASRRASRLNPEGHQLETEKESHRSSNPSGLSPVPDYLAAYWEALTRMGEHDEVAVQRGIYERITGVDLS